MKGVQSGKLLTTRQSQHEVTGVLVHEQLPILYKEYVQALLFNLIIRRQQPEPCHVP